MTATMVPAAVTLPEAGRAAEAVALADALREAAGSLRLGRPASAAEALARQLLASELERAAGDCSRAAVRMAREEAMDELAAEGQRLAPRAYGLDDGWEEDLG